MTISKARIVILNGAGSAGKSSIARALQNIASAAYLHVQMDAFLDMFPEILWTQSDGMIFETAEEDGMPSVAIKTGPAAERVMRGMRHAIAAMASQGNNLIVDEVMLQNEMAEYMELLRDCDVFRVGIFASLKSLEERERLRGDRLLGLARWQYPRVHRDVCYDLGIDTDTASPMECARMIRDKFQL